MKCWARGGRVFVFTDPRHSEHIAEIRTKDQSRLMRFLGWFLGFFGMDFMGRFWTTVSAHTIFAPVGTDLGALYVALARGDRRLTAIVEHEATHCRQARKWWFLFPVAYLLLPFPVLGAYCRWCFERQAYCVDLHAGIKTVDDVVESLWKNYFFPWPKTLMRRWFFKQGFR